MRQTQGRKADLRYLFFMGRNHPHVHQQFFNFFHTLFSMFRVALASPHESHVLFFSEPNVFSFWTSLAIIT